MEGVDREGRPVTLTGEFLHFFTVTERVRSHLPVRVQQAGMTLEAASLDYDHAAGRLELRGPQQAVLPARGAPR